MSILKIGMYASQFPAEKNYLTFSSDAPFSIKFNQISWDGVLEYSLDAENWYEWDASEINSSGNVLYLRGSGNSYITGVEANNHLAGYEMQITATDGVECAGNIMSLLEHTNPDNAVMANSAFASLFYGQDKLIKSPELPATVLAGSCYRHMLRGCTNLVVAPELPATVLASQCYYAMLQGCTSLVTAPELPATVLASQCYRYMLSGCTNLATAPELPATTLANSCYSNMLSGTSIAISETQTGIYQTPWRIPSVGAIESEATDWNTNMLRSTSGTFRGNPSINTTYYQSN